MSTVTFRGKNYTLGAISLMDFGWMKPKMAKLVALKDGGLPGEEEAGAILDLILASLKEHHPEVTREELETLVDLRGGLDAVQAIFVASGLMPGDATTGEAPASP